MMIVWTEPATAAVCREILKGVNAALSEIAAALGALPARWQEVLYRYYVQGEPVSRIATAMGYSESSVRTWKARAVHGLKKRFVQEYAKRFRY